MAVVVFGKTMQLTSFTVQNMSTHSTPSRPSCNHDLPVIDTRGHEEYLSAVTFAAPGHLTPPASAHESRRPSLGCGTFDDPQYSYPTASHVFSHSPTPVHAFSSGHVYSQPWSQQSLVQLPEHSALKACQISASALDAALTACEQQRFEEPLSGHTEMQLDGPWRDMTGDGWSTPEAAVYAANLQNVNVPWNMFHNGHDLDYRTASTAAFCEPSDTAHDLRIDTSVAAGLGSFTGSVYGVQSATVMPSQLSPGEEWEWQDYAPSSSLNGARESLASSFASSTATSSPLEYDSPRTPPQMYDEVVGYSLVHGGPMSPTALNGQSAYPSTATRASARQRRKNSRRGKQQKSHHGWTIGSEETGIKCEVGGRHAATILNFLHLKTQPHEIPAHVITPSKPHRCPHINPDGTHCQSRFERSEHLKRHQNKHSDVRAFQCPFTNDSDPAKKCKHEKGVSRSDNAGDHFKSHLKVTPRGRRNSHLQWPEVRDRILETYDEKVAKKLITNLEKWIRTNDAGEGQRGHLAHY